MSNVLARLVDRRHDLNRWDLFRPEPRVLAPYARQRTLLWRKAGGLLGLLALAAGGAIYGFLFATLPSDFLIYLVAPLALLGLAIIWVLPDQDTAPTGSMVKCFFGFVTVGVMWPEYLAVAIPGLPWISMRRLFLFPMVLCLLISISTSSTFRHELKRYLDAWPLIGKLLAAFVVIQALSISMADNLTAAVKYFVDTQILWTAMFFVSVYLFQKKENIHSYLKYMVLCACVFAVIAIVESHLQRVIWMDHIPSFLKVDQKTLDLYTSIRFRDGLYRAKSTFTNPLPYAEYMALVSPVLLYFIVRARSLFAKVVLIILNIALFYAMTKAQARLGYLGFILGHALFGLLWALRRWRTSRFSLIGPALSLAYPAFIVALCGAIVSVSSVSNAVLGSASTQGSNQARQAMFRRSGPVVLESPVFGHGPGQGAEALGHGGDNFLTIDSYFLSIALDYGLVGFLLYYGMIGLMIYRALQLTWRDETDNGNLALLVVVMLSVFLLIKSVLSQGDNNYIPFILMGINMALVRRALNRHPTSAAHARRTPEPTHA